MPLSPFDKQQLISDGYLLLPGAVPRARIEAALRVINHSLGDKGLPCEQLAQMRARTFCPELVSTPEILDLYRQTAVRAVAESAIGSVRTPAEGQIALRFPQPGPAARPWPHVDGMSAPDNGVPAGTLWHFTALAAVFLSDVSAPDSGNFTVWPGAHRLIEAHLRAHGPASLLAGFPALPLPPARPLLAQAGDALLAHWALPHAVSANVGPHVRYAAFFRLFHSDHEQAGTRPLLDLWHEWEGVR